MAESELKGVCQNIHVLHIYMYVSFHAWIADSLVYI